jgi:hypothetical protein
VLPLGLAGLAAAIGIAVLRYHLYDIGVFLRRALVYAALVVLIGAVYLVLVVTIGTRISPQTTTADRAIPFVVAAVLALIFQPVRSRLQRLANRLVYGKRASPYEVLANFSRGVSELYGDEDPALRMARVLAEGTEADRAEVWLRVGAELRLAASWPVQDAKVPGLRLESGESPPIPDAAAAVPVRYQGELLGTLAVVKREDITPTETQLVNVVSRGLVPAAIAAAHVAALHLDDRDADAGPRDHKVGLVFIGALDHRHRVQQRRIVGKLVAQDLPDPPLGRPARAERGLGGIAAWRHGRILPYEADLGLALTSRCGL